MLVFSWDVLCGFCFVIWGWEGGAGGGGGLSGCFRMRSGKKNLPFFPPLGSSDNGSGGSDLQPERLCLYRF